MNNNIGEDQIYSANKNSIYNQNINENSVSNAEKLEAENRELMRAITVIVLMGAIVTKFFSLGLLTIILLATLILPVYFYTFTTVGFRLADIKNKDKKDYICFAVLCITMLLWMLSFMDCGDDVREFYGPMEFMNGTLRSIIYNSSLITNILFLIISFYRCYKKNRKIRKSDYVFLFYWGCVLLYFIVSMVQSLGVYMLINR